jgi:hypothetical protein
MSAATDRIRTALSAVVHAREQIGVESVAYIEIVLSGIEEDLAVALAEIDNE